MKVVCLWGFLLPAALAALPEDFVYLNDIDPSIRQQVAYATDANFTGEADIQYRAAACILRRPVAEALKKIQQKHLLPRGLSLKIFDCYRPRGTVERFVAWAKAGGDARGKNRYHPRVAKAELIPQSYLGYPSQHSRGVAVDLTIVGNDGKEETAPPVTCGADRTKDELDMGTGFDCFDPLSRSDAPAGEIGERAFRNRRLLRSLMQEHGFKRYAAEWWHFQFVKSKAAKVYFDFDVAKPERVSSMP